MHLETIKLLGRGTGAGHRRQFTWFCSILAVVFGLLIPSMSLAQLRVVNYNIAQLVGDQAALENVLASLQDDNAPGFATPVSMFVFQEVRNADLIPLLNLVNATAPDGITYAAATYTNFNEDG